MNIYDWSKCDAVYLRSASTSSRWCFRDTAFVEVKTLLDELERGATIDDYVAFYPKVAPKQVSTILEFLHHNSLGLAKTFFKQLGEGVTVEGFLELNGNSTMEDVEKWLGDARESLATV